MAIYDLTASLDLKQNLNIYTTCKQFDSLNLILNIYDNSVQANLDNYNVRLKAMKSDKIPLIQEHIGITPLGNVVTIEADEQLTTTSGKTPIEVQFINKTTGKKKATFNLVLIVVPSTLEVDRTISKVTYTLLEELENKLDQASDFFENIDEAIGANSTLETTITNSETAKNDLEDIVTTGETLKTNLENDFSTGNILKEDLETTIINANTSKSALDTSKANADTSKIALDKSIEDSNKFAAEHSDVNNLITTVASHSTQLSENTHFINVKQFGAIGDGINDDTSPIQNAINYIGNHEHVILYFPSGKYLTGAITYDGEGKIAREIVMTGDITKQGYNTSESYSTTFINNGVTGNLFSFSNANVNIQYLRFESSGKTGVGIYFDTCDENIFRCKFIGFSKGVYIYKSTIVCVEKSYFAKNDNAIFNEYSRDGYYKDNYVYSNTTGYYLYRGSGNILVEGGKVEWNQNGIYITSGQVGVKNVNFDYNRAYAIKIDGYAFKKNNIFGVYTDKVSGVLISNNTIMCNGADGGYQLVMAYANNVLVTDNNFVSGGSASIENGGANATYSDLIVAPTTGHITVEKSKVSIKGNTFNNNIDILSINVINEQSKIVSKIQWSGNQFVGCSCKKQIYDYGNSIYPDRWNVFYSEINGHRIFEGNGKYFKGTFNKYDKYYDYSNNITYVCQKSGTIKDTSTVVLTYTSGSKDVTPSTDITSDILDIGDYITIENVTYRVDNIIYNDGYTISETIPTIRLSSAPTTSGTATLTYSPPILYMENQQGQKSISNTNYTLDDNYRFLSIVSNSSAVNITIPSFFIKLGWSFVMRCSWLTNDVNFLNESGTILKTITSSSSGYLELGFSSLTTKLQVISQNPTLD